MCNYAPLHVGSAHPCNKGCDKRTDATCDYSLWSRPVYSSDAAEMSNIPVVSTFGWLQGHTAALLQQKLEHIYIFFLKEKSLQLVGAGIIKQIYSKAIT